MQDGADTRDELDLGAYVSRVVHRWWIVALTVVAAVAIAVWQARDETRRTYEGRTLVYLGQPVTPTGQPATNAPAAQPLFAQQVVRGQEALENAAAAAGLPARALVGHVSIQGASGTIAARNTAAPYVNVVVRGPWGAKQVAAASQSLADEVVRESGRFQADKQQRLEATEASLQDRLDAIRQARTAAQSQLTAISAEGDPTLQQVVVQQGLLGTIQSNLVLEGQLSQQLYDAQSALASLEFNEAPAIIQEARGARVDIASRQANLVVAVLLGLIVGVVLALLSTLIWPIGGRKSAESGEAGAA